MTERIVKNFADTLKDIRRGDVISDATEHLRELVQRVKETGRPGALSLTLKVKPASKGDGTALLIEDDLKVKLPVAEKGSTILFATVEGNLQRNDPRQPELKGLQAGPASVTPITGEREGTQG